MEFKSQGTDVATGDAKDVKGAPDISPMTPKQVIDEFNAVYKKIADVQFMLNQAVRIIVGHTHDADGKTNVSVNHLLQELGALDAKNRQAAKG